MTKKKTKTELRQFGLLIAIAFPLIIGWIIPAISGHHFRSWTLIISFPSLIFAILKPSSLQYPYKLWIKLGNVLGFINSHIILGIVFLLILVPISFLMKIFGYDPLRKKRGQKTYREIKQGYQIDLNRIF